MSFDIIDDMLCGVTPEIYQAFLQGNPGDWFQMFIDGRVTVGPLPGKFRQCPEFLADGQERPDTSGGEECPIISIACGAKLTFPEFRKNLREQLENFY
jgi:hypothetical protein